LFKLKVSNLTQFFGALAKNGSFGIAKGRIVCRAKPNVPFVRLAKIVFKKCAVGKNKNTEALALESAVCWFICPVTLCLFLSFIFAESCFRLAGNDLHVLRWLRKTSYKLQTYYKLKRKI
jgi:hypothetical protein